MQLHFLGKTNARHPRGGDEGMLLKNKENTKVLRGFAAKIIVQETLPPVKFSWLLCSYSQSALLLVLVLVLLVLVFDPAGRPLARDSPSCWW
jgi:hypothetical protein